MKQKYFVSVDYGYINSFCAADIILADTMRQAALSFVENSFDGEIVGSGMKEPPQKDGRSVASFAWTGSSARIMVRFLGVVKDEK